MTFPKFLAISTVLLFCTIALLAFFKTSKSPVSSLPQSSSIALTHVPIPIKLQEAVTIDQKPVIVKNSPAPVLKEEKHEVLSDSSLPEADRIYELFNIGEPKLPFVETIVYKSRVPWLKGRPAWLSDYANFYSTSRHFIARSLNRKPDYLKQDIADGDLFNVFRKENNIEFYLLVDAGRCKMWFYAYDVGNNQRTLLKTYRVGLGRPDSQRTSGLLTPLGRYVLGSKVAIYRPKIEGLYNGKKVEMVRIFGSRWIPFEKELEGCSAPAKGLGIHGVPWTSNAAGGFEEDENSLEKCESDGCIRLATVDVEELFAIILTKRTVIEIVRNFNDAHLPGIEL